jgi:signal transduction histidine kinase
VLLLREALSDVLGERSRYILFVPVVLLAALYAGTYQGLLALLLSTALSIRYQHGSFSQMDYGDQVALLIYFIVGVGVILLANRERLHKRLRSEADLQLEELNFHLEQRVSERTAALEAANKELDQFCYSVAHDLRTPMRAIAGNARILLEDHEQELTEPIRLRLLRMETAANKLGDLVEGLLVYARLANQELAKESVDVSNLLAEAAKLIAREEKCEILLDAEPGLTMSADPKMMRIAITALVRNCGRYRKPGEPAHLHVSKNGANLLFRDEGIGFEMRYVHKIFQPFERLHRDDEIPGVGMGLAFVERIMKRHSGTVTATSELGQGAEFTLKFPP